MTWNNGADPFLVMLPGWGSKPIADKCLPHIAAIRQASAWKALGFAPKFQHDGRLEKAPLSQPYRFMQPLTLDSQHLAAIQSNLRIASPLGLASLEELIQRDVKASEFVGLPEHLQNYLDGVLLLRADDRAGAIPLFARAMHLNPAEPVYRNRYFETCQSMGDALSILDEIEANAMEIAGCVHSGKAHDWIKKLYSEGQKEVARQAIRRIDELLRQICNTPEAAGGWQQKKEWNISKHAAFVRTARSYGVKLSPYGSNDDVGGAI